MAAGKCWFPDVISRYTRFCLLGLSALCWLPAHAQTALEEVTGILAALSKMEASFEQSVQGSRGELVEYSTGQFLLDRPRFRWQVAEPYPQIIVSDGAMLRIFDPDLEQVTERPVTAALAATPLGLLAQEDIDLTGVFEAELLPDEGAVRHFLLTSTEENAPYQRIDLWVDEAKLLRIEVLDHFSQKLRVEFIDVPTEPWGESPFELTLPDNVEVVRG